MIPGFLISRLTQRLNSEMPCNTPCSNCDCPETVYSSDYQEVDSSPVGTQQARYFEQLEEAASIVIRDLIAE